MTIYFATDHAGFELKNTLLIYVRDELGYEVEDCGAVEFNSEDDYPLFIKKAAQAVSESPENSMAIILGASGQGEAIVANRFDGVRAVVYYGDIQKTQKDESDNELSILTSSRLHNNANVLSLGARFLDDDEAKNAVELWLSTEFTGEERHQRRISLIDNR